MNKWIAIPIIIVLVAGLVGVGFLYQQETGKLKNAQSEIAALEENISGVESSVSALQTELANSEAEVSTLEGDLAAAQAEVSTLEGDLAAAQAQVSTLEGDLAAAEAEVSTLEGDLAAAEAEVSALETELAASEAQVSALEAEVSALEAELAPVTFPDANLEAAIREALNRPIDPINKFHLEALQWIYGWNRNIQNLTGLEYCVNLRELWLSYNNISDISPLVANSGLSLLDRVMLSDNPLSTTSVYVYIPMLLLRGVIVVY